MNVRAAVRSWPFAWTAAAVLHVAVAVLPLRISERTEPQEIVEFELAELPAEPEPEPEPEPEIKPPGPKNEDPEADPEVTSLESNREVDETVPPKPVPIRTGLALDADQVVDGGMGVRVGNTDAAGYDADVAPGELQGFLGGGAGGGDGDELQVVADHQPELLRSFQPSYPPQMKTQHIEGRVLLRVQVLTSGRAGKVEVVQGVHPDLDRVAVEAMRRFRWRPARRKGKRIEAYTQIAIRFVLRDPD